MSVVAELAGGAGRTARTGRAAGRFAAGRRARQWLRGKAVSAWMNLLIAAAVGTAAVTAGRPAGPGGTAAGNWGPWALRLFALWCLSFLPGWLYVRFLDVRAKALWNEYVLSLHRLGWDKPCYLPRPPVASAFYAAWAQGRAATGSRADNIYRQKFEAYYGRQLSKDDDLDSRGDGRGDGHGTATAPSPESLFPLFMATAVFAAGWAAVLWDTRFLTAPSGPWDVLKYGFLGAYAFVASMLIRRFFQSDLRPSAYATAVYRIAFVLLIVAVLHQVIGSGQAIAGRAEMAVAFVVGFFPLVGLQALQRVTARVLRRALPPVTSDYPLDQLDGFNLWYEARLTEEGVEDMQNLTTMNLVDVILHTRVPPGRLVDWADQAFLLTHLERADRTQPAVGGAAVRLSLRRAGVRTATDLLKAFSVEETPAAGGAPRRLFTMPEGVTPPLPESQLRLLVTVLAQEPGLNPVWNWQRNGVLAHCG